MKRVSIVTVCLNCVDCIEKTIDSVVGQDHPDVEYIIIDGGSTDGTIDIIRKYDDRISFWISEPDEGIYDAMNKGVRLASGYLVGFINSGDTYAKGAIKSIAEEYEKYHPDVLYGNTTVSYEDHEEYVCYKDLDYEKYFFGNLIIHQSIFVRTDISKNLPFDTKYKILADYDFFLKLYCANATFRYIDTNIAYFRAGGISMVNKFQVAIEKRDILLKAILKNKKLRKYYRRTEDLFYYDMYEIHMLYVPHYAEYAYRMIREELSKFKRIIVFGTGEVAIKMSKACELDVEYYVDNDKMKQGKALLNKTIYSAEELLKEEDALIIVLSTRYVYEITKQLTNMRLSKSVIIMPFYELAAKVEKRLYCTDDKNI